MNLSEEMNLRPDVAPSRLVAPIRVLTSYSSLRLHLDLPFLKKPVAYQHFAHRFTVCKDARGDTYKCAAEEPNDLRINRISNHSK